MIKPRKILYPVEFNNLQWAKHNNNMFLNIMMNVNSRLPNC